jgi:hypothetical protein
MRKRSGKNPDRLTLETSARLLEFWKNNDRSGWLAWATQNERMINGQKAIPAVASRWFNLITIFHETVGDIWIHRDGDYLFWTETVSGIVSEMAIKDPSGNPRPYLLLKAHAAMDQSISRRPQSIVALTTP